MKTIKANQIVQLLLFVIAAFGIAATTGCDDKTATTNANTATTTASPAAAQPGSETTAPTKSKSGATGTISVSPNPIKVCDGSGMGVATISWTLAGTTLADVRIGSPDGILFVQAGAPGSKATGKWVGNGSIFYLQDVSKGLPPTADNTIAKVTANVTSAGCP